MIGSILALGLLVQAAQPAGPATFAGVYGWVYETGRAVPVNNPAAACLGLKTPQTVYERTWLSPDAKVHAVEVSQDSKNPFAIMSVRHTIEDEYAGKVWLAGPDGGLLAVCNSPFMYASFSRVKDGSLDSEFQSEKAYYLEKLGQRWKWDRYTPVKRSYP